MSLNNNPSIMDVRNVLGYPSTDLGTLCKCNNVNKWSRYKPVNHISNGGITLDQIKSTNYGLTVREIPEIVTGYTTTVSIPTIYSWLYSKPYGTVNSPYRLYDFRNYNHNAVVPMSGFEDITLYTDDVNAGKLYTFNAKYGDATYLSIGNPGNVDLPLNSFYINGEAITSGNWRIGLAYFYSSGSGYRVAIDSHPEPIGYVNSSQDIAKMLVVLAGSDKVKGLLQSGQIYTVIPFIGYKLIQETTTGSNYNWKFLTGGKAYGMPNGDVVNCKVKAANEKVTISLRSANITYSYTGASTYNLDWINSTNANPVLLKKPSNTTAKSCKIEVGFNIVLPPKTTISDLRGVFFSKTNQTGSIKNADGVTVAAIESSGYYTVTSFDNGDTTYSPILNTLNSFETYSSPTNAKQAIVGLYGKINGLDTELSISKVWIGISN